MNHYHSLLADLNKHLKLWRLHRTVDYHNALIEAIVRVLEVTIHSVSIIDADVERIDAARHAPRADNVDAIEARADETNHTHTHYVMNQCPKNHNRLHTAINATIGNIIREVAAIIEDVDRIDAAQQALEPPPAPIAPTTPPKEDEP